MSISGHDFLIGGDVITKINGTALTSEDKILEMLEGVKVGATITLTVFREGKISDVQYVLPERPILPGDLSAGASVTDVVNRHLKKQMVCCSVPVSPVKQFRH